MSDKQTVLLEPCFGHLGYVWRPVIHHQMDVKRQVDAAVDVLGYKFGDPVVLV